MGIQSGFARRHQNQSIKHLERVAEEITRFGETLTALSDEELAASSLALRDRVRSGGDLDDVLVEAYAVAREAADRVLGMRPYDVQVMAAVGLYEGRVCEMRTGEGKTLAATMPAYLFGLAGAGCHVVTANEYLAARDAADMGVLYRFLGLEVGLVTGDDRDGDSKRAAYAADITYGTAKEYGFDYLRDNMTVRFADRVQRGHARAVIDEADAILIDEARTPLVISGVSPCDPGELYRISRIVDRLVPGEDYMIDEVDVAVLPTEEGIARIEEALEVDNLYDGDHQHLVYRVSAALKARELFVKDREYIVRNGEIMIVDENTGRILDGRRWADGIHQALEAKERVKVSDENHTRATITIQNYFAMYDQLCGMTGTALDDAEELEKVYGLNVVKIPTHRPDIRVDHADVVYATKAEKTRAIIDDIRARHRAGQPVLVGTASVKSSEEISAALTEAGISHEVLNAKQHAREAEIIADAGRPGAVTVATNMAGRGVDIMLGGDERHHEVDAVDIEQVRTAGGLYVCGTERHEARRVDNQLRGRAGRQGDPGETCFYLSLEDDLMDRFGTEGIRRVFASAMGDGVPLDSRMLAKAIAATQKGVEGRAAAARGDVLKYDEVYDTQRKIVYQLRDQYIAGEGFDFVEAVSDLAERLVDAHCGGDRLDWDTEGLCGDLAEFNVGDFVDVLDECDEPDSVCEAIVAALLARRGDADVAREHFAALVMLDECWLHHLVQMDELRAGIGLRAIGKQDPLHEWRSEGFAMFSALVQASRDDTVRAIVNLTPERIVEVDSIMAGVAG